MKIVFISLQPAKPKGTLGLYSVRLSVRSINFPDFFSKRLQILTWFLACKSTTMSYRWSLSFVSTVQIDV